MTGSAFARRAPIGVCGYRDGRLVGWHLDRGMLWSTEMPDMIFAMAVSPDGRHVVIAPPSSPIQVRDAQTGALIRESHTEIRRPRKLTMMPDGEHFLMRQEHALQVWRIRDLTRVTAFSHVVELPLDAMVNDSGDRMLIPGNNDFGVCRIA